MKMSPVVHFEMPAKDKKRAADFYTKAFGWNMKDMDMGGGSSYLMAQTTETSEDGMVKTPGAINGGFFDYADKEGFNIPHLVLSVENLEEAMTAVKANGGQVNGEPMDIPGVGKYVSFKDSEGNAVGMLEPLLREK